MFQASGPATEKALSPKPVLVLGTSKEPDVEDLRVARPCIDDIGTRTSVNRRTDRETGGIRNLTEKDIYIYIYI